MQISRKFKAAVVAGVITLGVATPAVAASVNVSGGQWDYGTKDDTVYSNYLHLKQCHGSSVKGKYYASSGDVQPRGWAYASAEEAMWGNETYYRSNC
ncbi:lactococcin 972 family bacteriocin [Streptomyces sp. NPDC052496]|uniref:lactococcin 972 family bacteriocin n=1 Tax=Streptomyces sp. NPDC052496 TaxID=3154951 RepID=UPI003427DB30